jgi:hypothetical protein
MADLCKLALRAHRCQFNLLIDLHPREAREIQHH